MVDKKWKLSFRRRCGIPDSLFTQPGLHEYSFRLTPGPHTPLPETLSETILEFQRCLQLLGDNSITWGIVSRLRRVVFLLPCDIADRFVTSQSGYHEANLKAPFSSLLPAVSPVGTYKPSPFLVDCSFPFYTTSHCSIHAPSTHLYANVTCTTRHQTR